jgi:signal peptidase II
MTWLLALLVLLLDQWSKVFIRSNFVSGENLQVVSGAFNITYVHNSGAVWGILQNGSPWLAILSCIVIVVISLFLNKITENKTVNKIAIGLILGGIAGNLVDRIKFGAVTDFLDFYAGKYHWPAFNIADASICVGVVIYLAFMLFYGIRRKKYNTSIP